jgi:hypothetical protein
VSISSVVRFRRLHRETGNVSPAKFGGYKGYALAKHEGLVRQLVAERPDITLAEIKAVLATEKVRRGIGLGNLADLLSDPVVLQIRGRTNGGKRQVKLLVAEF